MRKSSSAPALFLAAIGLSMTLHSLFVLGQSALDSVADLGWRRTKVGWEHANSLPVPARVGQEIAEVHFPTLRIALDTVHQTHRLALPLALTGFMACLGPWMLVRWPTPSTTSDEINRSA